MSTKNDTNQEGWNTNTALGCDLKTILRNDRRMRNRKGYRGVLTRDSDAVLDDYLCRDEHYTFTETLPQGGCKRNPHVFRGEYINVTLRGDGTPKPNFRPMRVDEDFTVDGYALGVMNELRRALKGLVGK